ncbi:MAG: hypothetical protein WD716_13900 [Fimbriimonadaceae bacterium]
MSATVTLFRPVGPDELKLIEDGGFKAFPPRLPGQPIFYPVLNLDYAAKIAEDWNVRESGAGFVTRFEVLASFLEEFDVQTVGSSECQEYWIPAERLSELNSAIVGLISVVAEFHGVKS